MRTKRSVWALLVLLSCSLITACGVPESVHPLSPLEEAVPDPRLDGAWAGIYQDEPVYVFIQSADSGVMDVLLVVPDGEDLMTLQFSAHVTPAGDRRYVNLRHKILVASKPDEEEPDVEHAEWRIADRYLFAKYEFTDDGLLHLWYFHDGGSLEDAARSGELTVEKAGPGINGAESVITDEPEWILRFLEVHDLGENFEGPATLRRITGL